MHPPTGREAPGRGRVLHRWALVVGTAGAGVLKHGAHALLHRHLRACQQRSIARFEAARLHREPEFPKWLAELDPDAETNTDHMNAWIYESSREQSWSTVHQHWREGFQRFLELGEAIPEKDLLDAGRYPWLKGHPLAFILLASYDYHQEHLEKSLGWLREHGNVKIAG
jgi:hypothetical protein